MDLLAWKIYTKISQQMERDRKNTRKLSLVIFFFNIFLESPLFSSPQDPIFGVGVHVSFQGCI